jgi:hypothetical protein
MGSKAGALEQGMSGSTRSKAPALESILSFFNSPLVSNRQNHKKLQINEFFS